MAYAYGKVPLSQNLNDLNGVQPSTSPTEKGIQSSFLYLRWPASVSLISLGFYKYVFKAVRDRDPCRDLHILISPGIKVSTLITRGSAILLLAF